ncbi:helix-turn-helix domain-containing protein [Streptomyces apricus]|uniref:helix-turn-helix domain-containing protein n=1 Tax=Streptomyces apricus TaxID=1828112 RepID=UPI001F4811D4|nr:helix-turn-helix domain-containing protein [Streptomyces apricus]
MLVAAYGSDEHVPFCMRAFRFVKILSEGQPVIYAVERRCETVRAVEVRPAWIARTTSPPLCRTCHNRPTSRKGDDQAVGPLITGSTARPSAATVPAVFPHHAPASPISGDSRDAQPATLRRAIAFIEANAHADIAAAAGVTTRAVQLVFRRHLDATPLQYLRRFRLDRAHRELLLADPAAQSVTTVAYRWGFSHPGRFAADYRTAYGEPPSPTLRRRCPPSGTGCVSTWGAEQRHATSRQQRQGRGRPGWLPT